MTATDPEIIAADQPMPPGGIWGARGVAGSDAARRGTASDLLLALFGRVGFENLEVIGAGALARQLIVRISTE